MSNYRKRAQAKPTTAAGLRAQASANGSSMFGHRPRSIAGLFTANQSGFANYLGINSSNSYTPPTLNKPSQKSYLKNPYTNSINNLSYPSSYTTYGGTASGYGSLTLPSSHSTISSLNLAVPSTSSLKSYSNRNGNNPTINNRRSLKKTDSFDRPKKSFNYQSKSSSLQSLVDSEGYVSGNERSGRSSRLGSITSISSETLTTPSRTKSSTENGEVDYKKLWEESQAENERLKEKLRRSDEQLKETRSLLEKIQSLQNKSTLSEAEKRERRAMERKLSEMEEELKMMEQLKCENQRLKDENGALIRVISKLSK